MATGNRVPQYARIAIGAFVCCLVVLLLLVFRAEKLAPFGLIERLYYVVLVLMGMTAAVFLFGVLPSKAEYEGKLLGGTLKLSGAVVGAALVVVGGYYFAPNAPTFPLTVYVHGEAGPQDTVLRNSGSVVLVLGPERKTAQIGDGGQAYFPAVSSSFQGQAVPAWVESDEYESVDPGTKQPLSGSVLYLTVRKKVRHFTLAGTITDKATSDPLAGVHVSVSEYHATADSDNNGRFELQVAADAQEMVELMAQKQGYHTEHLSRTLGDTEVNFSLQRRK
jgi:CarboxypepD_reg-like domain